MVIYPSLRFIYILQMPFIIFGIYEGYKTVIRIGETHTQSFLHEIELAKKQEKEIKLE